MSGSWGSKKNGVRIGIFYSGFEISGDGSQARIKSVDLKIDRDVNISDSSNHWEWSGGAVYDGSDDDINVGGSGEKVVKDLTGQWQDLSYTTGVKATAAASAEGINYAGGTLSVSYSITYPKRQYEKPSAPTIGALTLDSASQATIKWANTSGGGPATSNLVFRSTDGGTYVQIASASGTATSYVDATLTENHSYSYKIQATNSGGTSAQSAASTTIYTTLGTPTIGAVSKAGSTITINWANTAPHATQMEVWHLTNGVRDGAALATVAIGSTSYQHTNVATNVTHSYQVRAKRDAMVSLFSATSDIVNISAPPSAPLVTVTPSLLDVDQGGNVVVKVTHRPVDATAQQAGDVQWRKIGAAGWTNIVLGAETQATIPASALINGATYEVQARTKGENAAYGPWSASVTFQTWWTPSVAAETPPGLSSYVTGKWTYADGGGSPQVEWSAELLQDGSVIESRSGNGAVLQVKFDHRLENHTTYSWQIQATNAMGLTSEWSLATWTTNFPVPIPPQVETEFDANAGAVLFTVTNPAGGAAVVENSIYRILEDDSQELVSTFPATGGQMSVTDPIPYLGMTNRYVVVASSAIPTTTETTTEVEVPEGCWTYISGGPGWSVTARIRVAPRISNTFGREKVVYQFENGTDPLEYIGTNRTNAIALSGQVSTKLTDPFLDRRGHWREFLDVADLPAPLCYRDSLGQRIFCSISDVNVDLDASGPLATVSASLVKVANL